MATAQEGKIQGILDERLKDAETARETFEAQWRLNLSWLIGRQYVTWQSNQRRLIEPPAPPWRIRLVANRILPVWRSALGRLLKTRPMPDVIPASGDEQDVLTAKVADKLIKHIWNLEALEGRKTIELYGQMLAYGTAFIMPWWNHETGEFLEITETLEPEELLEQPDKALERMGEIAVNVVSPFEVYPDPNAQSWDDLQWLFYVKALPVELLQERYPEHKDKIHEETGLELAMWPFDQAMTAPGMYTRDAPRPGKGLARLKEYFERPSAKYHKGRHGVLVGDTFIRSEDKLPYDHHELPLVKFDFIIYPGRFWGGSVIEQLIPLQREYNRTRSQIIENKNMMSRPKLLLPTTAGVPLDSWTTEPGEKIYYNPMGGKPEPWTPPPIPGYIIQELDRNERDMMEVSSQHWAMRGMNPPGVRTAAGIAMLQEADDTPFGPILEWNESSWRAVSNQIIELAKQFYTESRTVYLGLGSEADVAEFSRERLQGRYRVRVDVGSSLPMSRAARIQFALELLDRGAFREPGGKIDEKRLFQFLEMEAALDVFTDDQVDIRVARTENVEMRDRLTVYVPGEYDEHALHLQLHTRFMKELALEKPGHKAIMLLAEHIQIHEGRLREGVLKQERGKMQIALGVEELKREAAQILGPAQLPQPAEQPQVPLPPPPPGPPPGPPGPSPAGPPAMAAPEAPIQ